jgi:ABC-type sugar transport system substrate-binding protein
LGQTEIGYFDPDADYTQNKQYKVVYMVGSLTSLTQSFSDAFRMWAGRANCDYTDYSANNDADGFITSMEVFAQQGYDGFILDPEITIYQRVADVCDELQLTWMPGMGAFRDEEGLLEHPCVGFDNMQYGRDMAEWLIAYAQENIEEFDPASAGFISLDFSAVTQIHERTEGERQVWSETFPEYADKFFVGDGITTGQLTSDAALNMTAGIMTGNADIQFWLIGACADDYADGAARAAESLNKQDTSVCSTIGGTSLIAHWDAGEDSCWKSAIYTANALYTEPIFMGLYALMNGDATPETLCPNGLTTARAKSTPPCSFPARS